MVELEKILKEGARNIKRFFEDGAEPPSLLTEVKRGISDFWDDEVKPFGKDAKGEVRKGLEDFEKAWEEFKADPGKTLEEGAKFFKEQSEKFTQAISNSPILKILSDFLKSIFNMVVSIIKQENIDESWKKLKSSANMLSACIKEAFVAKNRGI